jgi:restriction system protein
VARKSNKKAREARKLADAGIKLLALGGAFAVVPYFLGKSQISQALASLRPIGLLMVVAGIALMLLGKKFGQSAAPAELAPNKKPATPAARSVAAPAAQVPQPVAPADAPIAAQLTSPGTAPERPLQWGKGVFDVIEWRRFEAVVERLFQQAGFETKSQSHGADEGVDVWLYSRNQPGEPVSLVQCKHWQGKRVGVDKIRELRGVMAARNVKRGQFATTSTFTPDAITFARENGVNLLDVDGLLGLIGKRTPDEQAELLAVALDGDYWRPTCVNCGVKMLDRTLRKGGSAFWGCTNYPRCKTTMPMRSATA